MYMIAPLGYSGIFIPLLPSSLMPNDDAGRKLYENEI